MVVVKGKDSEGGCTELDGRLETAVDLDTSSTSWSGNSEQKSRCKGRELEK
jgi:hypothetical protein